MRRVADGLTNRCSFRHSLRNPPLKLSTNPFCCGLPGAMVCQATLRSCRQRSIARKVSPVPLSLTIIAGRPRGATIGLSSRPTRSPDKSISTTASTLNRCLHVTCYLSCSPASSRDGPTSCIDEIMLWFWVRRLGLISCPRMGRGGTLADE